MMYKSTLNIPYFILLFLCLTGFSISAKAQQDSTEVHDVVYLEKGGAIKGKLLSLNEATGVIVFEDLQGRKYTLGKDEYDFIVEDKVFPIKKKREITLHPRKSSEIEYSVGLTAGIDALNIDLTKSAYYLDAQDNYSNVPTIMNFNAGKYFNENSYLGVAIDLPITTFYSKNFGVGLRGMMLIPNDKRNLWFYIPAELSFNTMEFKANFDVDDTLFYDAQSYSYPANIELPLSFSAVNLTVGSGVSIALKNKHSVNVEFTVFKQLPSSALVSNEPEVRVSLAGARFGLYYNL